MLSNVKPINCPIEIVLVLFAQSWCNVPNSVLPMTYSVDVEEPCYTPLVSSHVFFFKKVGSAPSTKSFLI